MATAAIDFASHVVARQFGAPTGPSPYDHTENNGPQILAVVGCLMTIGLITVILRVYVRVFMTKTMGADDYVMIAAAVSTSKFRFSLLPRSGGVSDIGLTIVVCSC